MERIKCVVSYDGTGFHGYQFQNGDRTVQGEIESVLEIITHAKVRIHGAGRTDAGVHAYGQVFHFDTDLIIKPEHWQKAFNSLLPPDIYIRNVEIVNQEFHARYSVTSKEYRYYLSLGEYDPVKRNYFTFYPYHLNFDKIRLAMALLEGEHDFSAFSTGHEIKDKVRTIYQAKLNEKDDLLEFVFKGTGFLRYQVRIMVGTLLEIGTGKREVTSISELFSLKDRRYSGFTAFPQGLYLMEINY